MFDPDQLRPPLNQSQWELGYWRIPRRPLVNILIVVDGRIGLDPSDSFGISKIIAILRKNPPHNDTGDYSYVRFDVDTASRDEEPFSGVADHTSFRFDQMVDGQPLINRYHQIWCFGFHPGNTVPSNPSDAAIEAHSTKMSSGELRALTTWMNTRRGGLLAMGDHHYLGATMAWKIPRVRAMRRWTNADGVPPFDLPVTSPGGAMRYRHDTNQPQNATQANPASSAVIPRDAEEDGIPQPIELRYYGGISKRPHPLLCTRLGAMNVLPDHPHEGWVNEDHEVPVDSTYDFDNSVAGPDFPNAVDGGSRPLPQAIAWAHPLPEPPYDHEKSPTPVTKFAVIGAYDGHRANVGRVVVDSTWHHWFNMNIDGLHAAGGNNWTKIKSYFRNCAVWLSPPTKQYAMLAYAAFWSVGSPLAVEEYDAGMPSWELGETARDILGQSVNPCMYYDWIHNFFPAELLERFPNPLDDVCLTCPPWRMIENAVLGGIIKSMLPERDRLVQERLQGKQASVNVKQLVSGLDKGASSGLSELHKFWERELERSKKGLSAFEKSNTGRRMLKEDLAQILDDLELIDPAEQCPDKQA